MRVRAAIASLPPCFGAFGKDPKEPQVDVFGKFVYLDSLSEIFPINIFCRVNSTDLEDK